MHPNVTIRPAVAADVPAILGFLRQLAAFEGAPDGVGATEQTLLADGFGERPRFEALLAEAGRQLVGMVILYQAYSSWSGAPSLMVHDLFVAPDSRGQGAGRALLAAAAQRAESLGCCRMDVNVLAWNERARRFYESLGFAHQEGWLPYRLDGAGLARLAKDGKS